MLALCRRIFRMTGCGAQHFGSLKYLCLQFRLKTLESGGLWLVPSNELRVGSADFMPSGPIVGSGFGSTEV